MAFVTTKNFASGAYETVKSLISTYIADPVTSSSEYRKWIYSREPDTKSRDFGGYPFIVINPANIDFPGGKSVDKSHKTTEISVEIEIVASDKGANNQNGRGLSHIDAITDDFLSVLNSDTGRNYLLKNGLYDANIDTLSVSHYVLDEVICYRRSIMLTFRNYKKVK